MGCSLASSSTPSRPADPGRLSSCSKTVTCRILCCASSLGSDFRLMAFKVFTSPSWAWRLFGSSWRLRKDSEFMPPRTERAAVLLLRIRSLTLLNCKLGNKTPMLLRGKLKLKAGMEGLVGRIETAWVWEMQTWLTGPAVPLVSCAAGHIPAPLWASWRQGLCRLCGHCHIPGTMPSTQQVLSKQWWEVCFESANQRCVG